MARIGTTRPPASPTTRGQQDRQAAMLRAAAHLGARLPLEQVQMSEVARSAGVALGTLYRYYPSKHHLYAGVLAAQVAAANEASAPAPGPATGSGDPVAAVADLVTEACRRMLARPILARAMITSTNVVRAEGGARGDTTFRDLIVRTAGRADPSEEDLRLGRLVEQTTYGILTWAVAGELTAAQAVADVRLACELLLRSR